LTPLDRTDLDNPNRENPLDTLAQIFNNPENVYFNRAIKYENGVLLEPYVAVKGYEQVFWKAYSINVSQPDRALRDADWIERTSKEMISILTKVFFS